MKRWLDEVRRGYNRLGHLIVVVTLAVCILVLSTGCTDVRVDLTGSTVFIDAGVYLPCGEET